MNSSNLAFGDNISVFVANVNGKLIFVLVDTKVKHHSGLRRWKVVEVEAILAYERPLSE